jgi:hypothetical protein
MLLAHVFLDLDNGTSSGLQFQKEPAGGSHSLTIVGTLQISLPGKAFSLATNKFHHIKFDRTGFDATWELNLFKSEQERNRGWTFAPNVTRGRHKKMRKAHPQAEAFRGVLPAFQAATKGKKPFRRPYNVTATAYLVIEPVAGTVFVLTKALEEERPSTVDRFTVVLGAPRMEAVCSPTSVVSVVADAAGNNQEYGVFTVQVAVVPVTLATAYAVSVYVVAAAVVRETEVTKKFVEHNTDPPVGTVDLSVMVKVTSNSPVVAGVVTSGTIFSRGRNSPVSAS